MSNKFTRHPFSNFFLIKGLQFRLIKKIIFLAILSTFVGIGTLLLVYYIKYDNTAFYPVSFESGVASIGTRANIVNILLPSLLISAIVNLLIATIIGLYASRKYAVPIFKLEQWANLLNHGHFGAILRFREKEEMRELSGKCNALSNNLSEKFGIIDSAIKNLKTIDELKNSDDLNKISEVLKDVSLEGPSFSVNTAIITPEELKLKSDQ